MVLSRSPAWYALHVKPHREHRVVEHLTLKSVPTFLPLIEARRRRRGRWRAALDPLFPGYLFAHLAQVEESPTIWNAVRWTPGVRDILGTNGIPVPVPGGVVESIQDTVREHGFIRPAMPFQPGSRVRFRSGPLTGLEALFEGPLSRAGRVRVLMTLLRRQTDLEVDAQDLEGV